jgi:hypothetical protein
MSDPIGHHDCEICMGRGQVMVGLSYLPGAKYHYKAEYDPCPGCTPPHKFHARRTAQRLRETRERRALASKEGE